MTKVFRVRNWLQLQISWSMADIFVVEVPVLDKQTVELIAKGSIEVKLLGNKKWMRTAAFMINETLSSQLYKAILDRREARPHNWKWNKKHFETLQLHLGATVLLNNGSVGLAVSWAGQTLPRSWITTTCTSAAQEILQVYETAISAFEEAKRENARRHEDLFDHPTMASARHWYSWFDPEAELIRPTVKPDKFLPTLRRGLVFDASANNLDKLWKAAVLAIANCGLAPPRDGAHAGIVPATRGRGSLGMMSWEPYLGPPAYPEVKAAVQTRLATALKKPRETTYAHPEFGSLVDAGGNLPLVKCDVDDSELVEALGELSLIRPDAERRDAELHEQRKRLGFEAIAWYQSWHTWSEGTWGIYFDAAKLDDLAASILVDLKHQVRSFRHDLAAFLAYGLVLAHENFHSRVEAALTWIELNALQSRYQRYNKEVYQALRETPDWLEEALANWWAWQWFNADGVKNLVRRMGADPEGAGRVVEAAFDFSPPGYSEWRIGASPSVSRAFATQLITGKPKPSPIGVGLPAESVIHGPLPYDFRPNDIPVRFIGVGRIADRLQSHPASFHVPTRREVEKVLKHFHCVLDRSGGKGGHQKWTGPDQRAFTLPLRDPVSLTVFNNLLDFLGVDKATYVRQIRTTL